MFKNIETCLRTNTFEDKPIMWLFGMQNNEVMWFQNNVHLAKFIGDVALFVCNIVDIQGETEE